MSILSKKIPVIYTLILALILSGLSFIALKKLTNNPASASEQYQSGKYNDQNCDLSMSRLKGYTYIQPLVAVTKDCESENLVPLKNDITSLIENEKKAGEITTASVFIKQFSTAQWTSVNLEERFLPGSLFKLPILYTILKMSENDPSFLNKKIVYDPKAVVTLKQTYETRSVKPGQTYTIKELLTYMIAYSDNNATQLLTANMDPDILIKVFDDLGLTKPDPRNYLSYTISPRDYSIFMNALYNAAYLNINNSEFATSLLAQCNFTDGLVKGLPSNTKIAHKFGEAGIDDAHELHETGIVYLNNNAYLVTVMTRGNDLKKLSYTISEISAKVYAYMSQHS